MPAHTGNYLEDQLLNRLVDLQIEHGPDTLFVPAPSRRVQFFRSSPHFCSFSPIISLIDVLNESGLGKIPGWGYYLRHSAYIDKSDQHIKRKIENWGRADNGIVRFERNSENAFLQIRRYSEFRVPSDYHNRGYTFTLLSEEQAITAKTGSAPVPYGCIPDTAGRTIGAGMVKKMHGISYNIEVDGTSHFANITIPEDLRVTYNGQTVLRKNLETTFYKVAEKETKKILDRMNKLRGGKGKASGKSLTNLMNTVSPTLNEHDPHEDHGVLNGFFHDKPSGRKDDGYIYVAVNPAMRGYFKIGFTTGELSVRIKGLSSNPSVPVPFILYRAVRVPHGLQAAEKWVHEALKAYRANDRREFFTSPIEVLNRVIDELCEQGNNSAHGKLNTLPWDLPASPTEPAREPTIEEHVSDFVAHIRNQHGKSSKDIVVVPSDMRVDVRFGGVAPANKEYWDSIPFAEAETMKTFFQKKHALFVSYAAIIDDTVSKTNTLVPA